MDKNESIPALLSDLNKVNQQKIIKIRFRKVEKKGYSLYLDMWYEGKREYQFLKLYVLGKRQSYYQDKENIKLAISIRDKKELELIQDEAGFELKSWKTKANFTEYYKLISDKTQREITTWKSSYPHIERFTNGHIRFRDIDEKFCVEYRDYLLNKVSVNSAHLYFSKFKACLKQAVKDKYPKV